MNVEVDWAHGAEHMRAQHRLTPQEADEAVADIDAVWFEPDPTSKSGRSVRVIGYSRTRRAVLTVILCTETMAVAGARTAGSPMQRTGAGMRRASSR